MPKGKPTIACYFGRLTFEQRKKLKKLGGAEWVGRLIDSSVIGDPSSPAQQHHTELAARTEQAEWIIKILRDENIALRRQILPRCLTCGGWVKPEQGGVCMPCNTEEQLSTAGERE